MTNYIRFDWAMKRLLRNKANDAVLEGLVTSLIGKKFKIVLVFVTYVLIGRFLCGKIIL